jgi:hypothetical protein
MMYPLLVFVHVAGAIGIFVALSIESVALMRLRLEMTPVGARVWMSLLRTAARTGIATMAVTIAAGVILMITAWHHQPWIDAAFVGIVEMAILGGVLSGRRVRQLRALLAAEPASELSDRFQQARSSVVLVTSLLLRISTALGIVALMTAKPGAADSAVILIAAVVAGMAISIAAAARHAAATGEIS